MKNKAQPTWSTIELKKNQLAPLTEYNGYFVDRFNDIYSARRKGVPLATWKSHYPSGATVERVTLFDNEGKRRQLSRRKTLISTLGKEEFERREELRKNKAGILEKEQKEFRARKKKADAESEKILQEMHKEDFSGHEVPLLSLDPSVRNMIKKARAKREQEALGDLF